MPPHLHPRSRMTMSLFTSTLMVSFLVVAAPHVLPCPVDPRILADSTVPDALTGEPRRKRRRIVPIEETCNDVMSDERRKRKEAESRGAVPKRECPVPKPGGLIGHVLGLQSDQQQDEEDHRPSISRQVQIARSDSQPRGSASE